MSKLKIFVSTILSFFLVSVFFSGSGFAQNSKYYLDSQAYYARNVINSGDNTINAIASGKSEILIVIAEDGGEERYTTNQYLNYIKNNRADILSNVDDEYSELGRRVRDTIAVAEYLFEDNQYSASAAMYERAVRLISSNTGAVRKLEGLATASFYGSARHVEGIKFICRRYQGRPLWDFRFRHAIHAHLRSLAENLGYEYAEDVIWKLRKNPQCQRDDISPVWIPIPLSDMRWLEKGVPPNQVRYGFSKKIDREYSSKYIKNGLPFSDYLLFVGGKYREIIDKYENSYIFDLALLGSGDTSSYDVAVRHLNIYLERYQRNRLSAIYQLMQLFDQMNDKEAKDELITKYSKILFNKNLERKMYFQINSTTRVWLPAGKIENISLDAIRLMKEFYTDCPNFRGLLGDGKYKELSSVVNYYQEKLSNLQDVSFEFQGYFDFDDGESGEGSFDYKNRCVVEFNFENLLYLQEYLGMILNSLNTTQPESAYKIGHLFKMCGDLRSIWAPRMQETKKQYGAECLELENNFGVFGDFHTVGSRLLKHAYDVAPFEYHHSLYLAALSAKNNHDYDTMLQYLEIYIDYHPNEKYADDALTDIGHYYLAVRGEYRKADNFFLEVVDNYSNSNSYDNALNWLVSSKRAQGKYVDTIEYSTKLLASIASERLFKKISGRHAELRSESYYGSKQESLVFGYNLGDGAYFAFGKSIVVRNVLDGIEEIEVGDEVKSVDGVDVDVLSLLFSLVNDAKKQGKDTISFKIYRPSTFEYKEVLVDLALL
ncbi:hypothetical protein [Roseibium sp.]|uniref:hypothetical protein n=1 Tax=Roseibium sp. TaxID=1936156 RepID=UPI003D12DF2D